VAATKPKAAAKKTSSLSEDAAIWYAVGLQYLPRFHSTRRGGVTARLPAAGMHLEACVAGGGDASVQPAPYPAASSPVLAVWLTRARAPDAPRLLRASRAVKLRCADPPPLTG
jgi:hypothetical protein